MRTESSVIVNLAEIMQLEHERVAAEHAVEQAAREAAERAAREQKERARREAERAERVQARLRVRAARKQDRAAREREAALLRVRLDAEARERLEREALERAQRQDADHARAAVVVQPAGSRDLRHGAWLAVLAVLGAFGLTQQQRSAAELAALRASERAAREHGAAAADERERLEAELRALRAKSQAAVAGQGVDRVQAADSSATGVASPAGGRATGRAASPDGRARPRAAEPRAQPSEERLPLSDLEDADDDPLRGLFDLRPERRKR